MRQNCWRFFIFWWTPLEVASPRSFGLVRPRRTSETSNGVDLARIVPIAKLSWMLDKIGKLASSQCADCFLQKTIAHPRYKIKFQGNLNCIGIHDNFGWTVDPRRIELLSPQCECGALPLDHGPTKIIADPRFISKILKCFYQIFY